jgi:hypothetical protein
MKLIRDRVPVDDGGWLVGHVQGDERIADLFAKLHEEADKVRGGVAGRRRVAGVRAGRLLGVLLLLAEGVGIPWRAVRQARWQKFRERGAFMMGRPYEAPSAAGYSSSGEALAFSHVCTSAQR